jgi:hypothetical protein
LLEQYDEIPQCCDLFRSLAAIASACPAFLESQHNRWLAWAGGGDTGTARRTDVGAARTATIFAIAASFFYQIVSVIKSFLCWHLLLLGC